MTPAKTVLSAVRPDGSNPELKHKQLRNGRIVLNAAGNKVMERLLQANLYLSTMNFIPNILEYSDTERGIGWALHDIFRELEAYVRKFPRSFRTTLRHKIQEDMPLVLSLLFQENPSAAEEAISCFDATLAMAS